MVRHHTKVVSGSGFPGWGRTRLLRHGLRARELRHPLETNPVVSLESAVAHIRAGQRRRPAAAIQASAWA